MAMEAFVRAKVSESVEACPCQSAGASIIVML